jgi:hypothetical protein
VIVGAWSLRGSVLAMPPGSGLIGEECGCIIFIVALPCGVVGLRAFFQHMHLDERWHSHKHGLHEHPVAILCAGFALISAFVVLLAACLECATPSKRKTKRDKAQ